MEEVEQRKMEVVGAGVGAAWGMARIGLGEEGKLVRLVFLCYGFYILSVRAYTASSAHLQQIIGPSTTPFLITMFSHPYATVATPAGEAVRVRIAGALGWIGRREEVPAEENEVSSRALVPSARSRLIFPPTLCFSLPSASIRFALDSHHSPLAASSSPSCPTARPLRLSLPPPKSSSKPSTRSSTSTRTRTPPTTFPSSARRVSCRGWTLAWLV
jgi:hypothetical protein